MHIRTLHRCICCTMILTLLFSMTAVANAAPRIQSNISKTAVSANLSTSSLPSSESSLKVGTKYYFNISATKDNYIKSFSLYVKYPGKSSYTKLKTVTANNYMRYTSVPMTFNNSNTGTLYYYWEATYKDRKGTDTFITRSVKIVGNSSSSSSAKVNSAVDWVKSRVGQSLDYDGVYGAQCVDLIKYYYKQLGVNPVTGNGKDYATNSLPSGWSRIKNCRSPQKGDILVV